MALHLLNKKKMRLHRLHKVNEKQADVLIKELTGEETTSLRLTHKGEYLIHIANTEHHGLVINAFDGSVIKQTLKGEGE